MTQENHKENNMDKSEQDIKLKLLQSLMDHMDNGLASKMKPVAVQVSAPDKEDLADGLDKAKSILGKSSEDESDDMPGMPDSDESEEQSDEERLIKLLTEDEDEEKGSSLFGRR